MTLCEGFEPRRFFSSGIPRFDHVVVLIEENRSTGSIVGNPDAPYLNHLRGRGASFTHMHGETHPSQPNYLYLFSGANQGVTDNATPPRKFAAENLGGQLFAAGLKFKGFAQSLPVDGFEGTSSGSYDRKHNPWVNFTDVPAGANLRFERFPQDANGYKKLPTVSFVVPDEDHNMHTGTVAQADAFVRDNLLDYANWATKHNSLLIVTWDESEDSDAGNRIPTFFVGANIVPGKYHASLNHLNILSTLEDMYGLNRIAGAVSARPISDIWLSKAPLARAAMGATAIPAVRFSDDAILDLSL